MSRSKPPALWLFAEDRKVLSSISDRPIIRDNCYRIRPAQKGEVITPVDFLDTDRKITNRRKRPQPRSNGRDAEEFAARAAKSATR
jgi:hypothetical protein